MIGDTEHFLSKVTYVQFVIYVQRNDANAMELENCGGFMSSCILQKVRDFDAWLPRSSNISMRNKESTLLPRIFTGSADLGDYQKNHHILLFLRHCRHMRWVTPKFHLMNVNLL